MESLMKKQQLVIKDHEELQESDQCWKRVRQELSFPPPLFGTVDPPKLTKIRSSEDPSILWYGQEVKDKTKIQTYLLKVFKRIESTLNSQLKIDGITHHNSSLVPIDM
jgi:hypothetical protein